MDNLLHVMLCAIWHHLYNLKNAKNIHGGVLLLLKLQASFMNIFHVFQVVHMVKYRSECLTYNS